MSEATIAVIDRLVERCPALKRLFDEHLEDNFGEVLPHFFLGEVTRVLVADATAFSTDQPVVARSVEAALRLLEEEFASGTDEIKELIAVSFLENLPQGMQLGQQVQLQLGPSLRRELSRMREQ